MGQCVTKCKNPPSSLGSKTGDKESGSKSHVKKTASPGEEFSSMCAKASGDILANGTKKTDVVESTQPQLAHSGDSKKEESFSYREEFSLKRAEELFSRKEFVEGCKALNADSIDGIRARFPSLMNEAKVEDKFKDLYRFTFQFGLDSEEGQRSLRREIAVALWKLVFTQNVPFILDQWLSFLTENPPGIKGISRDTWNMFLNFIQVIGPDLTNYSEDEAWPSLFDTFVEWEMERRRKEGLAEEALHLVTEAANVEMLGQIATDYQVTDNE
ncbi:DCN1-like protein 3 isoform X2 [Cetorhinus maximus]|uniref:DCN1-like protein 3 isoform X2 n=1 Tax=Carcharodon carcharias TaxID=13397 RepID=UPI001B7F194D|nr:DCN1-like protein 3 isoform X2 [Carcharodon carcharias]